MKIQPLTASQNTFKGRDENGGLGKGVASAIVPGLGQIMDNRPITGLLLFAGTSGSLLYQAKNLSKNFKFKMFFMKRSAIKDLLNDAPNLKKYRQFKRAKYVLWAAAIVDATVGGILPKLFLKKKVTH